MKWLIAGLLIYSGQAFGHGEGMQGPHGGAIQMPANYHTEVVIGEAHTIKVYLLDMQFKNPTTESSYVRLTLVKGNKKSPVTCLTMADYYQCRIKKDLNSGELHVISQRQGIKGIEVKYKLPIK
jgi:hypothetical protein